MNAGRVHGSVSQRSYWLAAVVMSITASVVSQPASAVPAFARQTGMACNSCHFQDFPSLNAFGRAFKQQGYTLSAQDNVTGERLSLPPVINAAVIAKVRYQKTNGDTAQTDTGELQFPDEAAVLIGGRAAEDLGFLMEFATFGTADTGTGDFSLFANFKAHYNRQIGNGNLGAVLFSTDTGGAPYGFELLNTGAQRMIRAAEDRGATSAQQFVGLGSGQAEGLAFVASNDSGFANLTLWTPDHGNTAVNGLAHYLRGAWTPMVAGWDTAVGFQYFGGTASRTVASGGDVDTSGWAIDAQAQGEFRGRPLGAYVSYATADAGTNNLFNTDVNDKKAWAFLGKLGVIPDRFMVLLGYMSGDNGTDPALDSNKDQRLMVGATWMLAQNVEVHAWNTSYSGNAYDPKPASGGDNLTSVMMFAGF